jgi:uncharacterized cupredoxin-like copper-binding protein
MMEVKMVLRYRRLLVWGVFLLVAGLILTACSGNGSSASSQSNDVTITATDFKFDSSVTTFKQGVTYHFIVTNKGSVNHEFRIMPPGPNTLSTDQVSSMSLAAITSDQLTPGTTKTVDYTFTKAYPAGALEFACHTPGHYEAGMHLPIVVQ